MKAYILESSLSLIFLFGLYWFLLRKEKLFVFNRYFLIVSVILSMILPVISVPVHLNTSLILDNLVIPSLNDEIANVPVNEPVQESDITPVISPVPVTDTRLNAGEAKPFFPDISTILIVIYIAGALLLFLRFVNNIRTLHLQAGANEKIYLKGCRIVLVRDQINPYCFFRTIFLNKDDYLNGGIDRVLLDHELQHIRQAHTVDILFIELIRIFYWFNPVLLLYRNAIKVNHEYLADSCARNGFHDIKSYSEKLLMRAFRNAPLVSGFNKSLIRKRLLMITKPEKGKAGSGLIIASSFLLAGLFSVIMSFKPQSGQPEKMIFVPHEEYDTTRFMETGRTYDIVTYSGGFYMSNEITNKEYREFTDWVKNNPEEIVSRRNDIIRKSTNPVTGKVRQIIFHLPEIRQNSEVLDELIDSSAMFRLSKRYENYFTDPKFDNYPVVGISAEMAEFYCGWKGKSEASIIDTMIDGESMSLMVGRRNYRHPTEKEWELAVKYSGRNGAGKPGKKLTAVNVENQHGLSHLNGNVSEWIVNPDDTSAIIRGGSWKSRQDISLRKVTETGSGNAYTGFRIVSNDKKRLNPEHPSLKTDSLSAELKNSLQQERTIKGIVEDKNGSTIETASIIQKKPGSQESVISGIVTDTHGKPLGGATIVKKGTNSGVIADNDGRFRIGGLPLGTILVISHQEYETREIAVIDKSELKIMLQKAMTRRELDTMYDPSKALFVLDGMPRDRSELKNVLKDYSSKIVGVGSLRGKDATEKYGEEARYGVVFVITEDYFKVKGKVLREDGIPLPGVYVNVSTELVRSVSDKNGIFEMADVPENSLLVFTSEGYKPQIVEAKFGTEMVVIMKKERINSKQTPYAGFIFVVDGKPKTEAELPDPASIESITVLKDREAISAYGDAAANGVIIVVTKNYFEMNKDRERGASPEENNASASSRQYSGLDNMPVISPGIGGKMIILKPDSTVRFK